MHDMVGDRNMNGVIPFTAVLKWGEWYHIDKSQIDFYWEIIKLSEGIVHEWHSKRTR